MSLCGGISHILTLGRNIAANFSRILEKHTATRGWVLYCFLRSFRCNSCKRVKLGNPCTYEQSSKESWGLRRCVWKCWVKHLHSSQDFLLSTCIAHPYWLPLVEDFPGDGLTIPMGGRAADSLIEDFICSPEIPKGFAIQNINFPGPKVVCYHIELRLYGIGKERIRCLVWRCIE